MFTLWQDHTGLMIFLAICIFSLAYLLVNMVAARRGHRKHNFVVDFIGNHETPKIPSVTTISGNGNLIRIKELNDQLAVKETALIKAHTKFNSLLENAPIMIASLNEAGQIDLWNKACEDFLGYTKKEVVYNPALLHPLYNKDLHNWVDFKDQFKKVKIKTKHKKQLKTVWIMKKTPDGTVILIGHPDEPELSFIKEGREPSDKRIVHRGHKHISKTTK